MGFPRAYAIDHDLFISYAHQADDPQTSREAVASFVAKLRRELQAEVHRRFERDLEIFFDREDIRDFDDWKVRCHRALRSSRFFLVCLTCSYLRSRACRWEWEEWCKHELERGLVGQGAVCLWFVRLEAMDDPEVETLLRQWKGELLQRFHIDCQEWNKAGPAAFEREIACAELRRLTEHVAQRLRLFALEREHRGNLGWLNLHFVGREPEMCRLHEAIIDAPASECLVGLVGIGGIGKTALALAFANLESEAFVGGCWLLRCEGQTTLVTVIRRMVYDLGIDLTEDEKRDDVAAAGRVLHALRSRGRALFLLDNVEHASLIAPDQTAIIRDERWLRVLFTSRLPPEEFAEVGASLRIIELDKLPEDQALDLMRLYQPERTFASADSEEAAREIIRLLDGLTLSVETAAVYLGQNDLRLVPAEFAINPADYLDSLRSDLAGQSAEGAMSQLREVAATLRPTLQRLDGPTRTVLQVASLLGPNALALPWLKAISSQGHPELQREALTGQSDPWSKLVRALIGMRLFQPTAEPRVVSLHQLLSRALAKELHENRDALDALLLAHIKERDTAMKKTTCWPEARWELEPFDELARVWADNEHAEAGWLLNNTAAGWYHVAEWTRAEQLYRRALESAEQELGRDHPKIVPTLNNLALLLKVTGRPDEAESLYRRALDISEAFHGADHPAVALCLNNRAQILQATDRIEEAESSMRRALAIDENWHEPNDVNVVRDINNLAALLQATDRQAEAEVLMRRALGIVAQLDDKQAYAASLLNNLAQLFRATNRAELAQPLLRRALAIDEDYYGGDHPEVATDLNNLAAVLQATGRYVEAEPSLRRALDIFTHSLGPDHPQTMAADWNLTVLKLNNATSLLKRLTDTGESELRKDQLDETVCGPPSRAHIESGLDESPNSSGEEIAQCPECHGGLKCVDVRGVHALSAPYDPRTGGLVPGPDGNVYLCERCGLHFNDKDGPLVEGDPRDMPSGSDAIDWIWT